MIPCICIDDKKQPVPAHRRVKEGDEYHITHIYKMMNMGGILGCDIYEKPLGDDCGIYKQWRLTRFAINPEQVEAFLELCKNCHELNDLDMDEIREWVKEKELQEA